MSLAFGCAVVLLPPSTLNLRTIPARHHHRAWKRRRLKPLTVHGHFNPTPSPLDNLFHSLLSQFPSVNSLNYIAPTLGFASGLALFLSSRSPKLFSNPSSTENSNSDIGEWILFTSPTPFNRFVTLRCPSICFPENELLEDVNEKLVKEDRHYVKLNSGRMIQLGNSEGDVDENIVYQRICVVTEDCGVLSLDWPANLDLEEERGMDTTVLIVPGTVEGSNERKIKVFVCECLRSGIFPVVVNPRGCAGSPLTTARLFTAADSDDISTAVQFISKKRPWTTLMGVGWEYGANVLTKYLAEFGEKTPLTAATCIDNPFDLEEATRSSNYHTDFNQRHLDGFIKILQCNKELFQGRGKGFDVERALLASSIRDFDRAISMVSYGFDTIEDFYAKCCTRGVVDNVKIPVLFIQNDDAKVPLFSVPRNLIAENPYTSLLLCSYTSAIKIVHGKLTISWCQHLTLEWLTAVELGLLKGRHPLLKDIDVTINPSKGLSLVERKSSKKGRVDKVLNLANGTFPSPPLKMFEENNTDTRIQSRSTKGIEPPSISKGLQKEDSNLGNQSSASIDAVAEEGINSFDNERGQVLQTAQVVMNMLDVTMPDVLSDEQKMKVLNAVGQGETLIKALQDAVPEDVRGKLTTAVSGILQSHGSNVKLDKLLNLGHIPDVASGLNSKVFEKIRPMKTNGEDVLPLDPKKRIKGQEDGSFGFDHGSNEPLGDIDSETQLSKISQKPNGSGINQSASNHGSNNPDLEKVNKNDIGPSEKEKLLGSSPAQISDRENVLEMNSNEQVPSKFEGPGVVHEDIVSDQKKVERGGGIGQPGTMDENNSHDNNFPPDQHEFSEAYNTEAIHSGPSAASEARVKENESENNQRKEESGSLSASSENNTNTPRFSVSEALNALTGFDDSTQAAVNSVFNVIEGMIDQLDAEKNNENNTSEVNGIDKVKEISESSVSINHLKENDYESAKTLDLRRNASADSSNIYGPNNARNLLGTENETSFVQATGEHPEGNFGKCLNSSSEKVPSCLTTFPYEDPLYKEYLKAYLYWKMRNAKTLDVDKMSTVYLDYIPEEGQWKLLDQTEDDTHDNGYGEDLTNTQQRSKKNDTIVEPSYVILDSSIPPVQNEEPEELNIANNNVEFDKIKSEESVLSIKRLILECLNVEVSRRASAEELELKLSGEIEYIANAVSVEAGKGQIYVHKGNDNLPEKFGTLDGEKIMRVISSAFHDTQYLRRMLPVGVVVGSSLAAIRKLFDVAALDGSNEKNLALDEVGMSAERLLEVGDKESCDRLLKKRENIHNFTCPIGEEGDNTDLQNSSNKKTMVGAVTAALGASALLAHQQNAETDKTSSDPISDKEHGKDLSKLDEMPEKSQDNVVTSLTEKALSVASPVVPMKEDGEVDHQRLVAMLAELGQKGGILKLVGKVALLWGGIRGAMSLTDKLISFFRIAERPVFQRILGFVSMVLLLWSPVFLPLLPTLMQNWATHNPFKIAEFACIAGLYISILIMITLWGKRIRRYDDPLLQYGLDLASVPKLQNFLKGLVGGFGLVILIHAVNSALGFAHLCWPTTLSSSSLEPVALIKSYTQMVILIVQGVATATIVSIVEELLFRSWLPEEIAADFGYHHGIVVSGLLFALSQRSLWEIPGLWLLSLSLSGARQRSQGSLSLPVGLRSGILLSNFMLRTGGFLSYKPNCSLWVTGGYPFQPFGGVVGLAFSLVLAVILYPKEPLFGKRTRLIRE